MKHDYSHNLLSAVILAGVLVALCSVVHASPSGAYPSQTVTIATAGK